MTTSHFPVRLPRHQLAILALHAGIRDQKPEELLQELVITGIDRLHTPEVIDAGLEHARQQLLTQARRIRHEPAHHQQGQPPTMSTPQASTDPTGTEPGGLVILSTDIGYDPDDFVNLLFAAHHIPPGHLVVITSDEVSGLRARLARRILDMMGRSEVRVIEGIDLGGPRRYLPDPDQHIPDYVLPSFEEEQDRHGAMIARLADVLDSHPGPVRWVGCGAMTELATLLKWAPHLADQLDITQMGGWLRHYRDPDLASHNFRIDPLSAGLALRAAHTPRLVMSEHTNHPAIRVTDTWPLIHALAADTAPPWAHLLGEHFQRWFTRKDGSWLHDPLTLSAALGQPFVEFTEERIRVAEDARLYPDPHGRPLRVSAAVDYDGFLGWFHEAFAW
ncbi:nucleoside hydrolase [Nocardia bovistercoris]|uniref:Nucleoside hydrolase n=1 Tax=Nocardia bovistercoris TaxID=2785916 RepID=A0A931IAE3_9NOCA|nr:nucleoside hydrolase [Nocardia bovistercoris]MBH0777714.1 nucleoside hydrolase [Nocardia bovistercoris]